MLRRLTLSIFTFVLILATSCSVFAKWDRIREGDLEGYLRSACFIDENKGWAVGDGGTIISTTNGGAKWEQALIEEVKSGDLYTDLWNVYFVDEKNGWIVGDLSRGAGTILYTNDGGKRWNKQNSGVDSQLFGVFFLDENNGWVVGSNGVILSTQNSGSKWTPLAKGKAGANIGEGEPGMWGVQFLTLQKGWVVGESGSIKMTTDGGKTWVVQNTGTDSNLSAVCFVNETTGWAVGEAGTIVATTDGGKTWTIQNSNVEDWLYAVDFINDKEGMASGEYGAILHTADGGKTWKVEQSGKQKGGQKVTFRGLSYPKPDVAYAAGDWGIVLKYNP